MIILILNCVQKKGEKMRAKFRVTVFLSLILASCGSSSSQVSSEQLSSNSKELPDIVATAQSVGSFNTLLTALEVAGLTDVLKSDGPFTVFAPTDEAFAKIPEADLKALLADKEALTDVLTYHVGSGELDASNVLARDSLVMLSGKSTKISANDSGAFIDGAKIVATDVKTSNGIMHVIDTVLIPSSSTKIFEQERSNIIETAEANGNFSILLKALEITGLTDVLRDEEASVTVLAPTNDAFNNLPAGVLENLLKPENIDTLKGVLLYHVIPELLKFDNINGSLKIQTLSSIDEYLTVFYRDGVPVLNDRSRIIIKDVKASNGIIQVIDEVLLPFVL